MSIEERVAELERKERVRALRGSLKSEDVRDAEARVIAAVDTWAARMTDRELLDPMWTGERVDLHKAIIALRAARDEEQHDKAGADANGITAGAGCPAQSETAPVSSPALSAGWPTRERINRTIYRVGDIDSSDAEQAAARVVTLFEPVRAEMERLREAVARYDVTAAAAQELGELWGGMMAGRTHAHGIRAAITRIKETEAALAAAREENATLQKDRDACAESDRMSLERLERVQKGQRAAQVALENCKAELKDAQASSRDAWKALGDVFNAVCPEKTYRVDPATDAQRIIDAVGKLRERAGALDVEAFLDALFAHGAKRLELRDKDEIAMGGWSRGPVRDLVSKHLRPAAPATRADRSKLFAVVLNALVEADNAHESRAHHVTEAIMRLAAPAAMQREPFYADNPMGPPWTVKQPAPESSAGQPPAAPQKATEISDEALATDLQLAWARSPSWLAVARRARELLGANKTGGG